jgi:ATP-dependent helicase/nuclease subunit B
VHTPRVYTVPPGQPFLECLARAILAGDLPQPGGRAPDRLDIPDYTLMLPTRRAVRALQEAFLEAAGGRATLLPRILAISEGQEELSLIASGAGSGPLGEGIGDIAPAMGEMQRRLTLMRLVMRWSEATRSAVDEAAAFLSDRAASPGGDTPAQAAQLAAELARFMDMVENEAACLDGLETLVPDQMSEHWRQTLDFLRIVTEHWPQILTEQGLSSSASRRNALILAEARRLAAFPPAGPVIVAGVTGSIPATAELIRAVARLPNGAIVLPALDQVLDEESWQRIVPKHPEHPQFGLKKLLDGLGIDRGDVGVLIGAEAGERQRSRLTLVSETMRPAATTERWADVTTPDRIRSFGEALDGLALIEAPTAEHEAEAIAIVLREAAETPGRTAALVTPDRLLGRRVANRLEAWGIRVDDSAGRPFAKTVPGAFLDLTIEAVASNFAPAPLMALLKHPLARLGLDAFGVRRAGRALEIAAFRRPYLGEGLDGVEAALERAAREAAGGGRSHPAVRRLWDEDWNGARDLVRRIRAAFAPLAAAYAAGDRLPLRTLAEAHVKTAEALSRLPDVAGETEPAPLWQTEAGETAANLFAELAGPEMPALDIAAADYADLYRSLIVGLNVLPRVPVHPRLRIWGPLEARLQQADVIVLGSLNDGVWPSSADPGPWLNRPMRAALGLPSPEETVGHAAHDFASLLGADKVVLTRALKVDGVPAVPSRWLMRLSALLGGMGLAHKLGAEPNWLAWAHNRDRVTPVPPLAAPEPRPASDLRPRRLSVSHLETWIANPYAIFARDILRLEPLDPLGQEPGPDIRGSVIHAALAQFAARHPDALPQDVEQALMGLAREAFRELEASPRVAAFWLPRFERFARWFAETEPARRKGKARVVSETSGAFVVAAPAGPFTLTARADRIDVVDGGLVISDYKTGKPPSDEKVRSGIAPQLPLEAAIAKAGHFAGIPPAAVTALRYIRASGGEPPGEEHTVKCPDVAALASAALAGLERLVARFDDPSTPYRPGRRAGFRYDYDEYAHLARVAEWSADTGTSEEA